ncbi:hypothetical protein ACNKHP_00340 [Shigella boydii]
MDDAARLRDALGVRLPESLPEIYLHRVSYPLRDLFLRYLRAHALVTAEQLAHEFSLGIAIVEEQLQQLREQGLVMNLQQDIWVSDEVFIVCVCARCKPPRSDASRCSHDLCAIAAGTSGRITPPMVARRSLPQHRQAFMRA